MRGRPRVAVVGAGLLLSIGFAGCGSEAGDTQPLAQGTVFVDGAFDGLPMFRAATAIQRPTEKDGVVAGSFETITARPDRVMAFYDDELERLGWTAVVPAKETGHDVWQGDWTKDGRRLEVSTSPLPSDDGTRTQIDLVLHEDATGAP